MNSISRRNMLRLAGGALGAVGVTGATLAGPGLLVPSASAAQRRIRAYLDKTSYAVGDPMVLRITEDLAGTGYIHVTDTTGTLWTRVSRTRSRQVWTAWAGSAGTGTVQVEGFGGSGRRFVAQVSYQVVGVTPDPAPPEPAPSGPGTGEVLIGMGALPHLWDQRVAEVGPGLAARRIFAELSSGANHKIDLVEAAHRAGQMPVISYGVGGDIAGAMSGSYNAVAEQAAAKLASYGLPTAVTFWHEPNPDITGANYAAASRQLLPIFKRGQLKVGPILNGWLLANKQDLFATFCPDDLFGLWDWFGIDTYEATTQQVFKPADAIRTMSAFVTSRGHNLPLGVGEYNGLSATTIAAAGEALLSTPNVWFGCVWNEDLSFATALSGDRLTAFRQTLTDPRSAEPRTS